MSLGLKGSSIFSEFRNSYSKELESFLDHFLSTPGFENSFGSVLKMAQYQLGTGGKRIRACLPGWFFLMAGKNPSNAVALGVAAELIHNATLVHDDLQDGDEYRRGTPTVWKKFSSPQAINSGDALFYFANLALLKFEAEPKIKESLFHHFSLCMLQVIEGQSQEFLMKDESYPSIDRYKTVVKGKTSGLFAMPIVSALIALGESIELQQKAQHACMLLGILFQIQDDILDLYGEKGREQKGSDISEGKVSYLVAHVFENGSEKQKQNLLQILQKPRQSTAVTDIECALDIFEQTNALTAAMAEIGALKQQIENICQEIPESFATGFLELCDFALKPISDVAFLPQGENHLSQHI